jgi:prepilin-type N-terminal cleavage/methylation domain-containing protein
MRNEGSGSQNERRDRMRDEDRFSKTTGPDLRVPNSKGFTLIEAIITIVIIGVISSIAALIILKGMNASSKEQNLSNVHYQARIAMERMSREIRAVRQTGEIGTAVIGTITGNPTNRIMFIDLTGATITYSLSGTTLNRTAGGIPSPLSSGVTSLQFLHYDDSNTLTTDAASVWTIEISMTDTQGADSLQMRTRVHPRNFN